MISPDGSQVVFARPDAGCDVFGACTGPGVSEGSIAVAEVGSWANTHVVAPSAGANNYYPAFSPDGEWIVYNRTNGGDSYDAPDAEVWVVPHDGGTPIRLANASPPPGGGAGLISRS